MNLRAIFGTASRKRDRHSIPQGATEREVALIGKYRAYTGASPARMYALVNAINYLDANEIPGDLVECGVYRGANPMLTLELRRGRPRRKFWLYDTFTGMTAPGAEDVGFNGVTASSAIEDCGGAMCVSTIDEVRHNFATCGVDTEDAVFVQGPVEETLLSAQNLPDQIAMLRLDTDWYQSTKMELDVLYPRLISGGVLIVDDYGCWQGSRQAVDEYFAGGPPLLTPVDSECRVAIKR